MRVASWRQQTLTVAAVLLAATASQAAPVASWNFDVSDPSDIGSPITSATDSVSGLSATPHAANTAAPTYGVGNGGGANNASANFIDINGVLEVNDPTGILTGHDNSGAGFAQMVISFDVDMDSVSSSTWALVRNGHVDTGNPGTSYNIFTNASGKVGVFLRGTAGSIQVRTDPSVLTADAGWQNVQVIWDGATLRIAIDGAPVALEGQSGGTSVAAVIGNLLPSDANFGIGGLVRNPTAGTIGQFLDGAIDNLTIANAVPEPASLGLLVLGGLMMLRRRA